MILHFAQPPFNLCFSAVRGRDREDEDDEPLDFGDEASFDPSDEEIDDGHDEKTDDGHDTAQEGK